MYDEAEDLYWCPISRVLKYREKKKAHRANGEVTYNVYQCESCEDCPLAEVCLSNPPNPRTVSRDIHEASRQKVAERMATEEGKQRYNMRSWIAETPFAYLKGVLGIRQFLLRGLQNVRTEWQWVCSGFNLGKLVRLIAGMRAEQATQMA